MSKGGKERITVRLSEADMSGLNKIKSSGDFEDMSASVRFCIHFSVALLRAIPAALINSFVETNTAKSDEEVVKNDPMEEPPQEVHTHCNGDCGK